MKYIIIGLGNYGGVLAEELSLLGNEVIGVDTSEHRVEVIKDKIAATFILDATEEQALSILPLNDVDIVIVAIGEDLGSSVRVVALLKKMKVKHIYARAVDNIHATILEAFNLDSILKPEKDAARSLSQRLDMKVNVESFKVDEDNYVLKFKVPYLLVGYKIKDLKFEEEFSIKIIALIQGENGHNSIGMSVVKRQTAASIDPAYQLMDNDELVCYGIYKDFIKFWKAIK